MKIWVVRNQASAIIRDGAKALDVFFKKPRWIEHKGCRLEDNDLARYNTYKSVDEGGGTYTYYQWLPKGTGPPYELFPTPFAKIFGYGDSGNKDNDDFVEHVWNKVCEHFGTKDIRKFKDSEEAQIEDFLLEIELSVKLV